MINENWKNITLRKYIEYLNFINVNEPSENGENYLAVLEDTTEEKLKRESVYYNNLISNKWSFLIEDFSQYVTDGGEMISINNQTYFIQKDFNYLSLQQWNDLDNIIKLSEEDKNYMKHINVLLAIVCQNPQTYDYREAEKLAEMFLDTPMYYIIPNINFFLFNEKQSQTFTLTSLMETETKLKQEVMNMTNNLMNITDNAVGKVRFGNYATKTLVKGIRSYLKVLG